jgi:hypothetical protein
VAKVNPQHVMALRRLTGLPVTMCRDALAEAGGDLAAVIRRLRGSPCCGLLPSEGEVATVLASHGVTYTPEVYQPVMLSDSEVVAALTAGGLAVSDYFLIDGLLCSVNARGQLVGCSIDDEDLAASARAYLRRVDAPEYPSLRAYNERGRAEPGATADRPRE